MWSIQLRIFASHEYSKFDEKIEVEKCRSVKWIVYCLIFFKQVVPYVGTNYDNTILTLLLLREISKTKSLTRQKIDNFIPTATRVQVMQILYVRYAKGLCLIISRIKLYYFCISTSYTLNTSTMNCLRKSKISFCDHLQH